MDLEWYLNASGNYNQRGIMALDVLSLILEIYSFYRFFSIFYDRKPKYWLRIGAVYLVDFILRGFEIIAWEKGVPNFILCIEWIIMVVLGFWSDGRKKYFLTLCYFLLQNFGECAAWLMLRGAIADVGYLEMVGLLMSEIIVAICVSLLAVLRRQEKGDFIPNRFHAYLLFIPLGSIYIFYYIIYHNALVFSVILILLLINIVFLEMFLRLNRLFLHEQENAVHMRQLRMVKKQTNEQKQMMREFYEERHNLVGELAALKGELETEECGGGDPEDGERPDCGGGDPEDGKRPDCGGRGDGQRAIGSLQKIIDQLGSAEAFSRSGNSTVDAVINFKYAMAKEYGIDVRLNLFVPANLPVDPVHLGVVLGNALDNAIEAAGQCTDKERVITVSMGIRKSAFVMVVENPYEGERTADGSGGFLSGKEQKHRHGYGLGSIMRIAGEYDGEAVAVAVGGLFTLTVVLNLT